MNKKKAIDDLLERASKCNAHELPAIMARIEAIRNKDDAKIDG